MQGKLPDHIKLPSSITVPFGSYEKVRDWRRSLWARLLFCT